MGAGQGTALRLIDDEIELLRETRDFARWTLADVVHLYERFRKTHGLAITESQFENLLLLKASDTVSSKEVFGVLDTNKDGRIDGLEFIAALVCVCRASFEDKARFAFDLFDFNLNGSLSLTELALLMKSVWVGMSLLTGHTISKTLAAAVASPTKPSSAQAASMKVATDVTVTKFLRLAQHAFDRYDRDDGASLQYEEFIEWARSNREFMLQVEQFRVISEKVVGLEDTASLPDGSDVDSDLEDETMMLNHSKEESSVHASIEKVRISSPVSEPWFVEPSSKQQSTDSDFPPAINVDLEWIYGYAAGTTRNTVRVLATGDVVYIVSKYAVVYSPERHHQRHYFGHKYPITCIDVNASATIIATGDAVPIADQHSEIHVWNGLTLECLAVLSSFHLDSIASVAFPAPMSLHLAAPMAASSGSSSNKAGGLGGAVASAKKQQHAADALLISVGTDSNSSMALWNWHDGRLIASGRATNKRKRVLCVAVSEDGHEILVAGEHLIAFHHVDGRFFKMKKPKALESKIQSMPICTSAVYSGLHSAVVGTARGELLQFQSMQLVRVVQAHGVGQSINVSLLSCRSMVLFTSGKDGIIKQWDSTLQPVGNAVDLFQVAVGKGLEDEDFRVHSLAYDSNKQRFVVGTRRGHLFEILESSLETRVIASSHRGADVSGLATSRYGVIFTTCSVADRYLRVWNMRRRAQQHALKLKFPPSACAYSTADGGEYLAVGGSEGSIALYMTKTMNLVGQIKNTQSTVELLRFHPSQSMLLVAVACSNGLIYFYSIEVIDHAYKFHRFALLKPSSGEPSSAVQSLDFSVDGRFLKSEHSSTTADKTQSTLRFWSIQVTNQSVSRVKSATGIRNVQWQSYSSTIGWHVSALGQSDLATLSSNAGASVVASLNSTGQLAFYEFPCALDGADDQKKPLAIVVSNAHLHSKTARAHLGFALHDTILLTTSSGLDGKDSGSVVCQWAITKDTQDSQPRATQALDESWAYLEEHGLGDLYFQDDTFVSRANATAIDSVLPPASSMTTGEDHKLIHRSEAPDLDLSLASVYGFNHSSCGVNQILVGLNGTNDTSSTLIHSAGTLLVATHLSATQIRQQRAIVSGLRHDISSVVKHSNSIIAVGSHGENRVLVWQWNPAPQLLNVLWGPRHSRHVLTTFDSGEDHEQRRDQVARDLAAVVWYAAASRAHTIRFYSWRKSHVHEAADTNQDAIEADMTRLPVLFGFFTPPLQAYIRELSSDVVGFVSGGIDHVSFWWFTVSTGHIVSQSGVFGRHAIVETATCGAYAMPYVITGMKSGTLVVWDNGVASYSLPVLEASSASKTFNEVATIGVVPGKQLLIATVRSGHLVLFTHAKESDASRYRANSFLQRVRAINVNDEQCVWKYPDTVKPCETNKGSTAGASSKQGSLLSVVVVDELQGGFVGVMSSGTVIHVDGQVLAAKNVVKFDARVVFDYGSQVNAVAVHPHEQWVAVGHENGRVSIVNVDTSAILADSQTLPGAVKAMAWQQSPQGRLAVSLANGQITMLPAASLSIESEFRCGPASATNQDHTVKKWCWVMRFSPPSNATTWLAAACRDYHIYVYKCSSSDPMTTELAHDFSGHTAPIASLDFSMDGTLLQSATSSVDCQLLRWQLTTPDQAEGLKISGGANDSAAWATWSVTFGGPVAGLSEVFGLRVIALDRIHGDDDGQQSWNSKLPTIAVGTETGHVLLGWYPLRCGEGKGAMFKEYDGYYASLSLVQQIAFTANNAFVVMRSISEGGRDGGVTLVWRTDYEEEVRQLERLSISNSNSTLVPSSSPNADADIHEVEKTHATALLEKEDQRFAASVASGGDEFMAVKPWLGAIREPSVLPPGTTISSGPPTADLALEFVYGMNANSTNTRNDVHYADDSWEIVYSAASFGVVYNTKTRTQLLNNTHSGQMISCVAVNPVRGDLVVTGEIAGGKKKPRLVAWDANSGSTITQIESVHTRGITLLAFAPSGDRVASIGMNDDHLLAIYGLSQTQGLAKLKLLAQMKTSKQPVYTLAFHNESDSELVTGGLKHVLFWSSASEASNGSASGQRGRSSLASGTKGSSSHAADGALTLSMKKGLFGGNNGGAGVKILAAVYVPRSQQQSHVVTAQHDGSLFVWKARQCVDTKLNAHTGAIYALVVSSAKPHTLFSGGQDGKINLWTPQLEHLAQLDLEKLAIEASLKTNLFNRVIKSLAVRESRILLSTDGGDVAELVPEDPYLTTSSSAASARYKMQVHLRSHCKGELWGLANHPSKMQFVTAGDDGSVRLWDTPTRALLAMYRSRHGGVRKWRAVTFSSDGSHVVAGALDGQVLVLNESLDTIVSSWKCCAKAIAVIKFDPDSRMLAIGTHDQGIYVYDGRTFKAMGVCRGHSSTVTHLDFSTDGRVLQSTSTAGELLFWDVRAASSLKQIPSATAVRDTVWATWTLPFGWPVQGIWAPGSDGSDVNTVARSHDKKVVSTGDNFGLVKLFHFPCVSQHAASRSFTGHVSHVTNCCFTRDDLYLISTGGLDNTVCQYRFIAGSASCSRPEA